MGTFLILVDLNFLSELSLNTSVPVAGRLNTSLQKTDDDMYSFPSTFDLTKSMRTIIILHTSPAKFFLPFPCHRPIKPGQFSSLFEEDGKRRGPGAWTGLMCSDFIWEIGNCFLPSPSIVKAWKMFDFGPSTVSTKLCWRRPFVWCNCHYYRIYLMFINFLNIYKTSYK